MVHEDRVAVWEIEKVLEGDAGISEIYPVTENGVLSDHHEINLFL